MILVILILVDNLNITLCQLNSIKLSCLIQLECSIKRIYHLNYNFIESSAVCVIPWIISCQNLFISLNILCDSIRTIIPDLIVACCKISICSNALKKCTWDWIHTSICTYCIEIWLLCKTAYNKCVIIWYWNACHVKKLLNINIHRCLFIKTFSVLIVLRSSLNQFNRHRGICGPIFPII